LYVTKHVSLSRQGRKCFLLPVQLTLLDIIIILSPFALMTWLTLYLRRYLRSVADYLAANRCAGRYLLCTSSGESGSSVFYMLAMLEIFSQSGFSLGLWNSFGSILLMFFGLLGVITYRYRQTRALTFHQLFEIRYGKKARVMASFLYIFSGIINFGVQPAVGARFCVYFLGLPPDLPLGGWMIPTFLPLMAFLMAASLFFTVAGGQLSVIVTDSAEAVISSILGLVVAGFVVFSLTYAQVHESLLSGAPGASFVDPFDIGSRQDFNGWYVLIGLVISTYSFRGAAWSQGFVAAAKSPHEGRMAGILASWRGNSYNSMMALISIGAFVVLTHPDFAPLRAQVESGLSGIGNPQLEKQMRMPMALGAFLIPGIKGAFCAIALMGLLAGMGSQIMNYGSTILQDVILPLKKETFDPKRHILWLRVSAAVVAILACVISALFKPVDYLVMITMLIGSIYIGGVGVVVWGGLYTRWGTYAGAMTSLSLSAFLGVTFNLVQQFWHPLVHFFISILPDGNVVSYLVAHADKCPLNGQYLSLTVIVLCLGSYVVVSLLTCREPYDLDKLLHRGKYRIASDDVIANEGRDTRSWLDRFLNIDEHFTRGDRVLTKATFYWAMSFKVVSLALLIWTVVAFHFSAEWWFKYFLITNIAIPLVVGVGVVIWFTKGVFHDMMELFPALEKARRDVQDDGFIGEEKDDP